MTLATIGLTPAQKAERLAKYRTPHTIQVVVSPVGGFVHEVCGRDGIRIFPRRQHWSWRHKRQVLVSGWRHDPDEIKALQEAATDG